jgi:mRNA interferase RelE/StbE
VSKFQVVLSSKARKFYLNCPKDLARRLDNCFEELESDPYRGSNIKRLKTGPKERLYRYRIGDFRIIYEVFEREIVVLIVKIAKREDAYKDI